MAIETIKWSNGHIKLIDQTKLPNQFKVMLCRDLPSLWRAIKRLSVRGAPALGVAAAFGVLLGTQKYRGKDRGKFVKRLYEICDYLATSRPTAVNLFHALNMMRAVPDQFPQEDVAGLKAIIRKKAFDLFETDRRVCRAMGDHGAKLIKAGARCLTVCNAGALATADYGTALGVFFSAKKKNKRFSVYACETRPLLQGARLTAWELLREKIDVTLICDNMAATLMKQGKIDIIFTGADRIAANGDAANKIGTYSLAVLAKYHKIPFYVVAPFTTFDLSLKTGEDIPIEERDKKEVTHFRGKMVAPKQVKVYNPAFDVTDHSLIAGIVTEAGIITPPFTQNIRRFIKE